MNTKQIIAVLLITVGVLGLVYGGFSFTKKTDEANIGPIHLSVDEKKHVNIPIWAGVGGVLLGGLMLFANRKR